MRRGRVLILLGLILALGTAAAVFVLLRGASSQPTPVEVEQEDVVVAIQPIPEDEPVEGRIDVRPMPKDSIPEGAIRDLESTVGMLSTGPIPQGTILHPDLLISPEEQRREGELGKLVEEGFVAVAHPIDELSGVSYGIRPGDHVDILMTFFFLDIDQETQMREPMCPPVCPGLVEEAQIILTEQRPRLATQLTLQDAEVLGVGRWKAELTPEEKEAQAQQAAGAEPVEEELPQYITLMLTPQDALVLKLAREHGASIDLVIRAQDDLQVFATQQVTLDYLLARFGISLPDTQPYSIEDVQNVRPRTGSE